jgi:hypothetical protein
LDAAFRNPVALRHFRMPISVRLRRLGLPTMTLKTS